MADNDKPITDFPLDATPDASGFVDYVNPNEADPLQRNRRFPVPYISEGKVPVDGTTGQVLRKQSSTPNDILWTQSNPLVTVTGPFPYTMPIEAIHFGSTFVVDNSVADREIIFPAGSFAGGTEIKIIKVVADNNLLITAPVGKPFNNADAQINFTRTAISGLLFSNYTDQDNTWIYGEDQAADYVSLNATGAIDSDKPDPNLGLPIVWDSTFLQGITMSDSSTFILPARKTYKVEFRCVLDTTQIHYSEWMVHNITQGLNVGQPAISSVEDEGMGVASLPTVSSGVALITPHTAQTSIQIRTSQQVINGIDMTQELTYVMMYEV